MVLPNQDTTFYLVQRRFSPDILCLTGDETETVARAALGPATAHSCSSSIRPAAWTPLATPLHCATAVILA